KYFNECRAMGIKILPPDIHESAETFSVEGDTIRFGLTAIKNVGASAIQPIMKARKEVGRFESFSHFCEKMDTRGVNKRVLESLIKSGAMDCFGSRKQMIENLDSILEDIAR